MSVFHHFSLRAVLILLAGSCVSSAVTAQSINVVVPAMYGNQSRDAHFNWRFESSGGGDVRMGQFACGSWWVAPASGDTGVTLHSLTGNPAWNDFLSCDADPVTESHGLLSGAKNYGSYNAAENVLANLPQTFTPASDSCISLVGAMRRNEAETSNGGTKAIVGEVADAYCVVTVMPAPPANNGADMIRPNITGATKEFLTWDDFDLSRLPTHNFIEGKTAVDWEQTRTRWRHSTEVLSMGVVKPDGSVTKFSEGGRAFRAHILHHNYASGMASNFNNDVLALFSTDSLEMKKPALAAMLAFGNDIYHNRYNHGDAWPKAWQSGAGQSSGSLLPPALLAALSKDESKADHLRTAAIYNHDIDPANRGPQELRQIKRGQTGVHLWGDGYPFPRDGADITGDDYRYWSDMKGSWCFDTSIHPCNPNRGKKTYADVYGYHDGPANKPGTAYMVISTGTTQSLAAAMILMPEIRSVVNTDAPIEYVDRVTRHGLWTAPDPVAAVSVVDQNDDCNTWFYPETCAEWGDTWGPNLEDPRFAIEDGIGRFTSMHGNNASMSYTSSRARDHWGEIIALYDGDTFEDNAVELGECVRPDIFLETGPNPRAHIKEATLDAEVRYTLDGSDPGPGSQLYSGPVPLFGQGEIKARAFHPDKEPSAVRGNAFSFPAKPAMRLKIQDVINDAAHLELTGLSPSTQYRIEATDNLRDPGSWQPLHEFTAENPDLAWSTSEPVVTPVFYRVVNVDLHQATEPVSVTSLH